ncbi:arrestin domain-containing protein 3-like [Entelurus aequoreus]|uniref:arrestin domain-containing protein 3-like n=1 Tax=Entelurus aequoreus TaxID=161455 RepID=UPI002B1D60C3|nr:arrestin domain-containing protein 3-like [Entelurus aequoreus]
MTGPGSVIIVHRRQLIPPFYEAFFLICLPIRVSTMFAETFKDFNINFNNRDTFCSGDAITGHISFELPKATKIRSVSMCLKGQAHVHWSTAGGKNRNRKRFSAKIDFFNLKSMILTEGAVGEAAKLPAGRHVYPFTCHIPQGDFPSSFRGPCGQISYHLTVSIDRPWHLSKDFVTELNFVHHINSSQPDLFSPLSGSNIMNVGFLCCASGPITMTASVEKKVFTLGETVKLNCVFSNASSRTVTPKVKLLQKQRYYTLNKAHKRLVVKNLVSQTGLPYGAGTSVIRTEMTVTIPTDTSLSISNCSILEVEYVIELKLGVSASWDLTLLFPIIIDDIPFHSPPPLYGE